MNTKLPTKILYISYWGINEGITKASVFPSIEVLSNYDAVERVFLVTIEREEIEDVGYVLVNSKITHIPFHSLHRPFLLDKLNDFIRIPQKLIQKCRLEGINKIICRSSMAGALGYLIWKKTRIPYYVESFEPHGAYMLESKVWSRVDPRYLLQQYFEKKQLLTASGLLTASENYKNELLKKKVTKGYIGMVPCTVNLTTFKFSLHQRESIRKKFNIASDMIVGIYVGKFGDIYYDQESFAFFKSCLGNLGRFFLLILTPQNKLSIKSKLNQVQFPMTSCWVGKVGNHEVGDYLSAADFAFCPVKSTPNRKYCSPIKNGEYWANGLPIVIPDKIGDDSGIIRKCGGGIVIDYTDSITTEDKKKLLGLVNHSNINRLNNTSVELAKKYRTPDFIKDAYNKIIIE